MHPQDTPIQLALFPAEKRCSGPCGLLLPLEAFSWHRKGKDGRNWWCRACNAAYCRAHHQAHREALNGRRREQAQQARHARPPTRAERDDILFGQGLRHCGLCHRIKPLDEFGHHARNRHGLMTQCRVCRNARGRGYRTADPEHARAWDRAWCRANPDRVRARWRTYERNLRETRPDDYQARNKRRYRRYKVVAYLRNRRWISANLERVRAHKRDWNRRHPEYCAANQQHRRARVRHIPGRFTVADVRLIFAAQRGRCAYCLASLDGGYHRDHMTPIARPGCTNWPCNIALACPACNHKKGRLCAGEFLALLIKARRAGGNAGHGAGYTTA